MRKCVLVIDDDPVFRQLLSFGLDQEGYQVETACDGAQAQTLVESCRPDVIVVDTLMPIMDGFKFLHWLKEEAEIETPAIVLTSVDSRALVVEALVAGAADVVMKPIGLSALTEKIESLLNSENTELGHIEVEEKA